MFQQLQTVLRFFIENRKAHWPRIIYPAIVCAFVIYEEQLYVKYTIHQPTEVALLSMISGGLFYFAYYHYVHKVIRVTTDKLFGLPTFDFLRSVLEENGLPSITKNGFTLQAILGQFFVRNPNIRSQDTIMASSMFHAGYMTCMIGLGYCCLKFIATLNGLWVPMAVIPIVVFIAVMWADHKFGDSEECVALQLNKRKLAEMVRKAYK